MQQSLTARTAMRLDPSTNTSPQAQIAAALHAMTNALDARISRANAFTLTLTLRTTSNRSRRRADRCTAKRRSRRG